LIAYCERRDQLKCLVTEVLRQWYDDDVAQLLFKLPACSPRKKIVIFVANDLLEDTSKLIEELAAKLGVPEKEVDIIALAAGGSMRLLIGVPEQAVDVRILSGISSLGNGKYQVVSINLFESLDSASQKAWRLVACGNPPVHRLNALHPAISWEKVLGIVENPIYPLSEHVLRGKITLAEAMQRALAEHTLAQANDITICQLNNFIRTLTERDLAQAIVLAVLNCQVARLGGSDSIWGHCNLTLGWLYLQQYDLEPALQCYQEALKTFEAMPEDGEIITRIHHDMGQIRERHGEFETAIAEYQRARTLAQEMKLSKLESDAWNGLGRVHLAQEQVDDAIADFQRALEVSQGSNDPRGVATALGNLGLANHFLGRLGEAEDRYQDAIAISREIDHEVGTGRLLGSLGNVLIERGELDRAEQRILDALAIARQYHDRRGKQQRLNNLGNLYQARARRETDQRRSEAWLVKAELYHREALSIARERDDRRSQGDHLTNLGNACYKLRRFEEARECYAEALPLAEEQNVVDTQWRVHYAWGNLCAAQQRETQAYDHYARAIHIVEQQRGQLRIESKIQFWQERTALYKRMVLCCLRLGKLWSALEYTELAKARYLVDLLAQRTPLTKDPQGIIQAVLKALPPYTAVVDFNVTEAGTVVFVATDQLEEGEKGSIDDSWRQSSDGRIRAKLIENFDRDTLQHILVEPGDSGEVAGGYLVDYYRYVELLDQIDRVGKDCVAKARAKWQSTLESASARIYEAILAPVHQELAQWRVERVVFMPNLGLSLLPLHASYKSNGTERDYLLDHYEITYAPSFDVLHHCQRQTSLMSPDDGSLFAVVNPTGDLAWAEFEVEHVAKLFQPARVLGGGEKDRATTASVIAAAPDHAFVHFACHGEFNLREPLKSALKLAPPESLTLETALKQLELPLTRLVMMSACETGHTDPGDLADEYLTLPAGFLLAGAPGVVSTLWTVDDLSTALLMQRFYLYHLRGDPNSQQRRPLRPAEALRRAQQWLRDEVTAKMAAEICLQRAQEALQAKDVQAFKSAQEAFFYYDRKMPDSRPFAHPVYWAPFTMSGQ